MRGKIQKRLTLSVDWSNRNNEFIVGFCKQEFENSYIVLIKDISNNSHTSEFLCDVVIEGIDKIQKTLCVILRLVTNNAENMNKIYDWNRNHRLFLTNAPLTN